MALERPPGFEEMFFEIRDTLDELEIALKEDYFPRIIYWCGLLTANAGTLAYRALCPIAEKLVEPEGDNEDA